MEPVHRKAIRVDQPHIPAPRWFVASFGPGGQLVVAHTAVAGLSPGLGWRSKGSSGELAPASAVASKATRLLQAPPRHYEDLQLRLALVAQEHLKEQRKVQRAVARHEAEIAEAAAAAAAERERQQQAAIKPTAASTAQLQRGVATPRRAKAAVIGWGGDGGRDRLESISTSSGRHASTSSSDYDSLSSDSSSSGSEDENALGNGSLSSSSRHGSDGARSPIKRQGIVASLVRHASKSSKQHRRDKSKQRQSSVEAAAPPVGAADASQRLSPTSSAPLTSASDSAALATTADVAAGAPVPPLIHAASQRSTARTGEFAAIASDVTEVTHEHMTSVLSSAATAAGSGSLVEQGDEHDGVDDDDHDGQSSDGGGSGADRQHQNNRNLQSASSQHQLRSASASKRAQAASTPVTTGSAARRFKVDTAPHSRSRSRRSRSSKHSLKRSQSRGKASTQSVRTPHSRHSQSHSRSRANTKGTGGNNSSGDGDSDSFATSSGTESDTFADSDAENGADGDDGFLPDPDAMVLINRPGLAALCVVSIFQIPGADGFAQPLAERYATAAHSTATSSSMHAAATQDAHFAGQEGEARVAHVWSTIAEAAKTLDGGDASAPDGGKSDLCLSGRHRSGPPGGDPGNDRDRSSSLPASLSCEQQLWANHPIGAALVSRLSSFMQWRGDVHSAAAAARLQSATTASPPQPAEPEGSDPRILSSVHAPNAYSRFPALTAMVRTDLRRWHMQDEAVSISKGVAGQLDGAASGSVGSRSGAITAPALDGSGASTGLMVSDEMSQTAICAVCDQRVRGPSAVCSLCGHGGHLDHIREWFDYDGSASSTRFLLRQDDIAEGGARHLAIGDVASSTVECPAGCGCRCVAGSTGTPRLFRG